MTQERINDDFSEAMSRISEADREKIEAYMRRAQVVARLGTRDRTAAVEAMYEEIPGVKEALGRYDKEITKIRKSRVGR